MKNKKKLSDEELNNRFDLYGALYLLCNRWHSGQNSRGYRILSRLQSRGYKPGNALQNGFFETQEQVYLYRNLYKKYRDKI